MTLPDERRPARHRTEGSTAFQRLHAHVGAARARFGAWVEGRRRDSVPIDLACVYVERDREQLTAILGSAIALRLFLFMVPTVAMSVAMIRLVAGPDGLDALMRQSSITGELAQEVNRSTDTSTSTLVLAILTAAWIAAWAGRNLVVVLAACSGTAWHLEAGSRRATLRVSATVVSLVFVIVITAAVTNRLRSDFGLAGSTTSWVVGALAFTAGWFLVMWTLPMGTTDPAQSCPGRSWSARR